MADTTTYFGNAVPATYPDGGPIIVNGRPLLLPQNFDLRTQINAARFQSTQNLGSLAGWFYEHYAPGSSGDPQRQAGYSGGFDPTYTDGGNYGYGLSAAAAGLNLDLALLIASNVNFAETGKPLSLVNERAIRQAYGDYVAKRFPDIVHEAGKAYIDSVSDSDAANAKLATANVLKNARADIYSHAKNYFFPQVTETDVQRYAKAHWGDLNSPDAQAFIANFQQAFGSYPKHLDLDLLHPLTADGSIPSGKDVSLFVGRNGEVLTYPRTPAPGGTGALRAALSSRQSPTVESVSLSTLNIPAAKVFKPLLAPSLWMIWSLLLVMPSCSRYGRAAGVDGEAEQGRVDLLRHVHHLLFGADRVWLFRPFCRPQNGRAVHCARNDAGRPISLGTRGLSRLSRFSFARLLDE